MTISSTTNTVSYTGNGSTTAFAVPYAFFGTGTTSEIQVVEVVIATGAETVKSNGSDYTVAGGSGTTGTVTAATAPASTVKWVINRATTQTQETDYVENDPFPAESHEEALDRLTAIDQEQQRALDRTAQLPDGYTGAFDPTLPTAITGSTVLAFNAGATAFEVGPTTAAISDAATNAAAAASSATASAGSATLASQWASLNTGIVASTDYSSKAWSIGGTGVTTTAGKGAAKEWATATGAAVDTAEYSAKEYATGTTVAVGSAKLWAANAEDSVVASGLYSSLHYSAKAADSATAAAASATSIGLTTRGDLLKRGASANERLAIGGANTVLLTDGTDPAWGQVSLTAGVTGTLPLANGGTGATSLSGAGIAALAADQTFTAAQRGTITTDNDLSFDQDVTNNFQCTPAGTGALTFTNHTAGQSGNILLINTGGHAISLAATTKGDANLATTISAAGTYWLSYYDDGTNAYVVTSAVFA